MSAQPIYLWFLLGLPVLWGLFWYAWRRSDKAFELLGDHALVSSLVQRLSRRKQTIRAVLMIGACAMLIIALSRPRWGMGEERVQRKGLQIMMLMDGSTSMAAQDLRPSRIEVAKEVVVDLLERLEGDQVGMMMFGATSYVQFPLTTDLAAARTLVEPLNPRSLTLGSTDIAAAIDDALRTFPLGQIEGRTLVIISDGGDPDPERDADALAMAREAAKAGLTIHTIGVGTTTGAPIPLYDQVGEISYVEENGQRVQSQLNQPLLEQVASATGGIYFDAQELDIQKFVQALNTTAPVDLEAQLNRRTETERFYIFVSLALILLVSDILVSQRRVA